MEMAVSLWQLVFSQVRQQITHPSFLVMVKNMMIIVTLLMMLVLQEEPALLKKWLHFLEKHPQVVFACH